MPVEHWDVRLVFLLSERLDPESRKLWESELSEKERKIEKAGSDQEDSSPSYSPATFNDLVVFLEKRSQTLGMIADERRCVKRSVSTKTNSSS